MNPYVYIPVVQVEFNLYFPDKQRKSYYREKNMLLWTAAICSNVESLHTPVN